MSYLSYRPPLLLKNGLAMTLYTSFWSSRQWGKATPFPRPPYQDTVFQGADGVPIFGWVAMPERPHGTIIGTYGITGELSDQWSLRLFGRKAFARNYAVVLFDPRARGKTAELSAALSSDGLYEGEDFVRIAARAKTMGCPAPFWLMGFSLGGQLALWGIEASQRSALQAELGLQPTDIAGVAALCPNLDSNRTLDFMDRNPKAKLLEIAIARKLKQQTWRIHQIHPGCLDPEAIQRATTIRGFDRELIINRLGFPSVEDYYTTTNTLALLPKVTKPCLILYAEDDPIFDPSIIPDLQFACANNPAITLILTRNGGHVSHLSSRSSQLQAGDPDCWWAWNRILDWCDRQITDINPG